MGSYSLEYTQWTTPVQDSLWDKYQEITCMITL